MKTNKLTGFCIGAALLAVGCGSSDPQSVAPSATLRAGPSEIESISDPASAGREADRIDGEADPTSGDEIRCIIRLHGKGGSGSATSVDDEGIRTVAPTGNEDGWGGRQWIYFPNDRYVAARDVVMRSLEAEGCTRVVINGFSNGASFAASLLCNGETFGNTVSGYVIDDPVTDTATAGCAPAEGVARALYWTSAIARPVGTDCNQIDWTCAGGTTVAIETYAANLGTPVIESPNTNHSWYWDAPEIMTFLGS